MIARPTSPGADALLGRVTKVLNLGFVQAIDYMGNDSDVVQAARVSFGQSPKTPKEDRDLLRYMMRNQHTTPFEMCEVKFRCKMPIFVARQWIRHRTANVNEISYRHTEATDEFYLPALEAVSVQATDNKQGRSEEILLSDEDRQEFIESIREGQSESMARYKRLIKRNVSRELARSVLPVSVYTQWIWKIDLHNLFGFLRLRLDKHAQLEIRVFAEAMAEFVAAWVPESWSAFADYKRDAVTFSALEQRALTSILHGAGSDEAAEAAGLQGREAKEFVAKLVAVRSRGATL